MTIRLNKTYETGTYRVFMTKGSEGYSVWIGEGYNVNEIHKVFAKRFDAVCHVEIMIEEFKCRTKHAA